MTAPLRIASLHIYPVKGVRAVDVRSARAGPRGLDGDRRWIITDEDGRFLTQRECGGLARIEAERHRYGLFLRVGGGPVYHVPTPAPANRRRIVVWRDGVDALEALEAQAWVSAALGRPARLFHMDDAAQRLTPDKFAAPAPVSFADGYPILIVTAASLDTLNAEIVAGGGAAVGMERFRPNVVIDGADPWAEDGWAAIRIGGVTLDLVKPCDRCAVTTIDQATGASMGKEPLKSLARLRRSADPRVNGVLFGWNAIARGEGEIEAGDRVEIVARRDEGWALE